MAQIKTIYGNEVIDDALRGSVANEYSSSSTYAVGDMVLKEGQLYKCNTAISTAEAWTAAHWTAVTVGGELSTVKDGLNGWSNDTKTALLNCFAHVAWTDEHGQNYIDALEDALYPEAPPATLESISCVYTQSGTVYDTDSLDDLKSDLVVTAHYSDTTTATISSGYSLSGTLMVGTSTITVTYSGKTTTFTVTVTATPTYQLANGTHNFTQTNYDGYVTISNHRHVTFDRTNAPSSGGGANFLCLSDLDYNGANVGENSNINNHSTIFSLQNGDEVRLVVSNVSGSFDDYTIGLRKGSGTTSVAAVANQTTDCDTTVTVSGDSGVGCLFIYVGTESATTKDFEADVAVYVNDVQYF